MTHEPNHSFPEEDRELASLVAGHLGMGDVPEAPDAGASLAMLNARIDASVTSAQVRGTSPASMGKTGVYSLLSVRQWAGYAAAAVIVAFLGTKYIPAITDDTSEPQTRTYTTNPGQRAQITLASGAQVILAPATTLRVTGSNVELDGQAFFTVKHSAHEPFTVTARNSSTRVLGTTFAVRAYKTDNAVQIVVAEGRVNVMAKRGASATAYSKNATGMVLSAGDAAQVVASGNINAIPDINLAEALGWTQGKLVFDRASFRLVLLELQRVYNVKVRVADNGLAEREVTGTLTADNLTAVIGELCTLLNARYERTGSTITFHSR